MELLAVFVALAFYIGLALISSHIAAGKGRDGCGWLILTLIFPVAILFVLIAPAIKSENNTLAPTPPGPKPLSSSDGNAHDGQEDQTANRAPSDSQSPSSDDASTFDWDRLLKYDQDIVAAMEKLGPYGDVALAEFRLAFEAVGGDRTSIERIVSLIIEDIEKDRSDHSKSQ